MKKLLCSVLLLMLLIPAALAEGELPEPWFELSEDGKTVTVYLVTDLTDDKEWAFYPVGSEGMKIASTETLHHESDPNLIVTAIRFQADGAALGRPLLFFGLQEEGAPTAAESRVLQLMAGDDNTFSIFTALAINAGSWHYSDAESGVLSVDLPSPGEECAWEISISDETVLVLVEQSDTDGFSARFAAGEATGYARVRIDCTKAAAPFCSHYTLDIYVEDGGEIVVDRTEIQDCYTQY